MATFKLEIDLNNSAFEEGDSVVRVLSRVADRLGCMHPRDMREGVALLGINGNTIGSWKIYD